MSNIIEKRINHWIIKNDVITCYEPEIFDGNGANESECIILDGNIDSDEDYIVLNGGH